MPKTAASGARFAIRLLQDAAEKGEIDPWDIDVITVIDGFLDQLSQRIQSPQKTIDQISKGTDLIYIRQFLSNSLFFI